MGPHHVVLADKYNESRRFSIQFSGGLHIECKEDCGEECEERSLKRQSRRNGTKEAGTHLEEERVQYRLHRSVALHLL